MKMQYFLLTENVIIISHAALIFDLEGVLIDHTARQCEIASKALASIDIEMEVTPQMYQLRSEREFHITKDFISGLYAMHKGRLSLDAIIEDPSAITQSRGMLGDVDWKLVDEAVRRFDTLRSKGVLEMDGKTFRIMANEPALPGIKQMLHNAIEGGYKIAMVTAGKKVDAEKFMRDAGLLRYFEPGLMLYGEDKVTKEGLFGSLSSLFESTYGIPRSYQFVVEDSLSGIKDAIANRLSPVLVLSGNTSERRAQRYILEVKPALITLVRNPRDVLNAVSNLIDIDKTLKDTMRGAKGSRYKMRN